ncbi:hypothetical protein [Nocardia shimofusensis]|uniref:hypothetical protein n=1 Tax=Nocardia shimofusensis TaxID=228596 RepID=UPI000A4E3166|nr:hypothetical protein [Nocardia shimofusensis]
MADLDESEIISELVVATGEAAALAYPDWTHAVSTKVYPSRGVSTWEVVAYKGDNGQHVDLFDHDDIDRRICDHADSLFQAQGSDWVGMKCSIARSGQFRIEYSYDTDEAIKWAGDFFGGSTPEELVEILRPVDL